ncbi:hypothetical protein [Neobacillus sp. PS3-40]|uniref:hypothetical protein n=1 Tax=Neobacillus sp. PS3-40 TaxID=3070679 RepID=UPI0027E038C9|nr:hypothetical protein [Neobacillus sp. PS3-40]WML45268.1 hypothetical protein RCG20_05015 [Neobacillus sp. PS3-40]
MLKKLLALLVITTFLSNLVIGLASAETSFQTEKFPYKEMDVRVMPEFDYPKDWPKELPSLLVAEYGTITNKSGQDYDGKIEIPVPTKEKNFQINLTAEFPDVNKAEVERPYDVDKEKGIVSWKPVKPIKKDETYNFVVEYYVNSIEVKDQKSFKYELTNGADIDQLNVTFFAPMDAKNIVIEPKAQSNSKSEYGEELYYYQYKDLKKGNNLKYSFTYQKVNNDSTMSVINKQQPPKDANHDGTTSTGTNDNKNVKRPIIGVGGASIIGLAIIIAGVFVFLGLKGNQKPQKTITNNANKSNKNQSKKPTVKKESKFANTEEKKELRKKLLNGKIDQETYEEEMKKLI